jgi:hypothetical protein
MVCEGAQVPGQATLPTGRAGPASEWIVINAMISLLLECGRDQCHRPTRSDDRKFKDNRTSQAVDRSQTATTVVHSWWLLTLRSRHVEHPLHALPRAM